MRQMLIGLLFLGACCPVRAGVYNLTEPTPNVPPARVANYIFQLRGAAVPPRGKLDEDSPRAVYRRQVATLEQYRKAGTLSTIESVNLSAAYIRLGQTAAALRVLRSADQSHFLVQANLAGAYQQANELELAFRHQQQALSLWPTVWVGWTTTQLEMYRECERTNLRLINSRLDESRRGPPLGGVGLDPLFPGVRFVADDGKYHGGQLARSMADKLPQNATNIVFQLTTWQPEDWRLRWLLAELLNAHGYVEPAAQLLQELVETGKNGPGLRQHRKELASAARVMKELRKSKSSCALMSGMLLIPTGTLPSPGAGNVARQVGALAPMVLAPYLDRPPPPPMGDQLSGGVLAGNQAQLPFNWRHASVSFIFGFLAAALLGFQMQQWRRRRRPAENQEPIPHTGSASEEAVDQPTGAEHVRDPGTAQATGWQAHPDRPEGIRRVP